MHIPFFNVSGVQVEYGADMQRTFGPYPICRVYIVDGLGYLEVNVGVKLVGIPTQQIIIDMGGPASGIIVIK